MVLEILDKSVAKLREMLPRYSLGELELLKDAETKGKTRKGAIEAIEEALSAADLPEPESDPCIVTPAIEGMTIRLHDGTRLPYGESAATTIEHATHLREIGLAL